MNSSLLLKLIFLSFCCLGETDFKQLLDLLLFYELSLEIVMLWECLGQLVFCNSDNETLDKLKLDRRINSSMRGVGELSRLYTS